MMIQHTCLTAIFALLATISVTRGEIVLVEETQINIPTAVFDVQHWVDEDSWGYAFASADTIAYLPSVPGIAQTIALGDSVEILKLKLIRLGPGIDNLGILAWWRSDVAPYGNHWHYVGIVHLASGTISGGYDVGYDLDIGWWRVTTGVISLVAWPPPPAVARWAVSGSRVLDVIWEMQRHEQFMTGGGRTSNIVDGVLVPQSEGATGYFVQPFADFESLRIVSSGYYDNFCYSSNCSFHYFRAEMCTTPGGLYSFCNSDPYCHSGFCRAVSLWNGERYVVTADGELFDAETFELIWSGNFESNSSGLLTARLDGSFDDRILMWNSSSHVFSVHRALPFHFLGTTSAVIGNFVDVLKSETRHDRIVTYDGTTVRIYRPEYDIAIPRRPTQLTIIATGNSMLELRWPPLSGAIAYRIYGSFLYDSEPGLIAEVPATTSSAMVPASSERSFFTVSAVYP